MKPMRKTTLVYIGGAATTACAIGAFWFPHLANQFGGSALILFFATFFFMLAFTNREDFLR